jgi:hypothetical protein
MKGRKVMWLINQKQVSIYSMCFEILELLWHLLQFLSNPSSCSRMSTHLILDTLVPNRVTLLQPLIRASLLGEFGGFIYDVAYNI